MNLTPLSASILAAVFCQTPASYASACMTDTCPKAESAERQPGPSPRLMLAKRYQGDIDLSLYWISEKLDGVRAYWDGQQLISRQGYPIRAPLWFTQELPATPLDGELWSGRGKFETTSAAVRRYQPREQEWRAIQYRLFDLPGSRLPFQQRIGLLKNLAEQIDAHHITPLNYSRVTTAAELLQLLHKQIDSGAEGLMLNRSDALYQGMRSDALLKLKMDQDDEARVLAYLPGKGKYAGMLGALRVQLDSGEQFQIGSGFTDQQRRNPPPIGSIISFKYFGLTVTGKPRFASFIRPYEPEPSEH